MSTSLSGSTNSRYNPDEPSDQQGRWSTSGSSWRNNPLRDPSAAGRAHTLLGHALASACHQGLIREFKLPTQGEAKRFSKVLAAWNAASDLKDESFRECFTRGLVDDLATVRRLRQAAAGSVTAQTFGQMVDASRPLTAAIKNIGAGRWPGLLGFGRHAWRLRRQHRLKGYPGPDLQGPQRQKSHRYRWRGRG